MSRTIGYDEVFYFHWVDVHEQTPTYYPHHLYFSTSSYLFQKAFTALTGIDNTSFIQRFKNIFITAIGLCLFFTFFYIFSKRYFLSLALSLLIGVTATVWGFVSQNETSLIPALLINLAFLSLIFYKRFPLPHLFIILFSVLCSIAILLHQAYLLMLPSAFIVFLFTSPRNKKFPLHNLIYAVLFGFYSLAMIGGSYFYIGHVELNLSLEDNEDGAQVYMAKNIKGNFFRYFYLLKSTNIWGKEFKNKHAHTLNGYGRSYWIGFDTKTIDFEKNSLRDFQPSNLVWGFICFFFVLMLVFLRKIIKNFGLILPALLIWLIVGSRFIMWWEPWYIEHWTHLVILSIIMFFLITYSIVHLSKNKTIQGILANGFALIIFLFAGFLFSWNFKDYIKPHEKLTVPGIAYQVNFWTKAHIMEGFFKNN
ncbi:MAG: hypothetical protein JXR70_12185 [Spirochaetales bacterium]|nr:hypothetical protein [Spirochaetales bacterium]